MSSNYLRKSLSATKSLVLINLQVPITPNSEQSQLGLMEAGIVSVTLEDLSPAAAIGTPWGLIVSHYNFTIARQGIRKKNKMMPQYWKVG